MIIVEYDKVMRSTEAAKLMKNQTAHTHTPKKHDLYLPTGIIKTEYKENKDLTNFVYWDHKRRRISEQRCGNTFEQKLQA